MKKACYLLLITIVISLSACGYNEPEVSIKYRDSHITMKVGQDAVIEVQKAKRVEYHYSATRNTEIPVFEVSDFEGKATTIHALNQGTDTLYVFYNWTAGVSAYGKGDVVIVNVVEE